MIPESSREAYRRVSETLHHNLQLALANRMIRGQPLRVDLGPGLVFYRAANSEPQGLQATTPSGLRATPFFRKVTTFEQVLREPLTTTLRNSELLDGSSAAIPLLAVSACRLAGRLIEQLGQEDRTTLDSARMPPDFDNLLQECLRSVPVLGVLVNGGIARAIELLRQRVASLGQRMKASPTRLCLCYEAGTLSVEWTAGDGNSVHKESLLCFVQAILAPVVEGLVADSERSRPIREHYRQIGDRILRNVCPGLADAVQLACQHRRSEGLRLCTSRVRKGIPLDVWVYVSHSWSQDRAGCTLSVNRAHRDFILGASDLTQYYFPPCLLTARMTFAGSQPVIGRPMVRQPQGGYMWCHPYTGPLGPDPFAGATVLHEERTAMFEPSEQAVRLFPALASRTQVALEGMLCLAGQDQVVRSLQERLQTVLVVGGKPDVLAAVNALHDTAKLGLTRGHQNNGGGPRVPLGPKTMPYPLLGHQVSGDLARRTFAFDPNRGAPHEAVVWSDSRQEVP